MKSLHSHMEVSAFHQRLAGTLSAPFMSYLKRIVILKEKQQAQAAKTMKHNILIIDGDIAAREILELNLLRMGADTITASTLEQAIPALKQTQAPVSLCLSEITLADSSGPELINALQAERPTLPVAIISQDVSVATIVTAIQTGAYDYTQKPASPVWLKTLLQRLEQSKTATPEQKTSAQPEIYTAADEHIIGESAVMQALKNTIKKLARSKAPVYIQGESGSGKELVAHEIHRQGSRNSASFIPVNCGAIPENLMESEFFGHKKGSFTGANTDKQGLFQAADGGTLFLDEVADLPLDMQVKLLRAIQEGAVKPIGETEESPVDVRILSATHKSLEDEVLQGRFRQDLYYRLNVIQLDVPPLRERGEDVLLLIDFFMQKIAQQWQLPISSLTEAARQRLLNYSFPGNVRELENILERAYTLCEAEEIDSDDLQIRRIQASTAPPSHAPEHTAAEPEPHSSPDTHPGLQGDQQLPDDVWNPEDADAERDLVARALDYTRWNRTRAARILGMTFRQLSYRIQKYGLDADDSA